MKRIWVCLLVGATCVAMGQEAPKKLSRVVPQKAASNLLPVTRDEAKRAFDQAGKYLGSATKLTIAPSKLASGGSSVTRAEVVAEFARLYAALGPQVKLTPMPVKFDTARLKISSEAKPNLLKLVRLGAVAPYGPLAAKSKDWLNVEEFGDALGFFIARMAEVTHMPSRKWSPTLQD